MKRVQSFLLALIALSIFPAIAHAQAWSGIINSSRAIDWTGVGISGGIPSSSWAQCTTTACNAVTSAGTSVTTAQITAALASAPSNSYVLLGPGTYNFSGGGGITFPSTGHVVLRGSGSNSTFLVIPSSGGVGCGLGSALICIVSSDQPYFNEPQPNMCSWTAGYTQGSTSITLSNASGACLTGINPAKPTMLMLEQCETGFTASSATAPCTGSATDNNQLFVCSAAYSSGPVGCSEGAGNEDTNRGQWEETTATAVNTGTGVVTIADPLIWPNWSSGQTPRVWIQQPIVDVGVENMAIDDSSNGSNDIIAFDGAYQWWVSGVKFTNWGRWGIETIQCQHGMVQNNYFAHSTGVDSYGVRFEGAGHNLVQNNIFQQTLAPVVFDGPSSGDVIGYNFAIDQNYQADFMKAAFFEHAVNAFELYEGNVADAQSNDGDHGDASMITRFRNFFTGWDSCANGQCGSNTFKDAATNSFQDFYGSRYQNNVANVNGTPTFHTTYINTSGGPEWNASVEVIGAQNNDGIPADPLVASTSLHWAEYDSVTAAVRFCGSLLDTGWSTTCGGISQIPTALGAFLNSLPTKGDLAVGQASLPASFYLSSKPSWFGTLPFPLIGPDVSGGNVGQCTGTLNASGHYAGMPATSSSQCTGASLASSWGGHVNTNPAMNCFLNVMGGVPDGTGSVLAFDANACYGGSSSSDAPNPPTNLIVTVN